MKNALLVMSVKSLRYQSAHFLGHLNDRGNNSYYQFTMDGLRHYLTASQPSPPCSIELLHTDHLLTEEMRSEQFEGKFQAKQWQEEEDQPQENQELLITTVHSPVRRKTQEKRDLTMCHPTAETRKSVSREPKNSPSRYARIIQQKNRIIQQLTAELQRARLQAKTKTSCKFTEKHIQCLKEREFLQRNNTQLFEELAKCKLEKYKVQMELVQLNQLIPSLMTKQIELQTENAKLKQVNAELDRGTREMLTASQKEVVIVSKMRQILADKLNIQQPPRFKEKQEKQRVNDRLLSNSKSKRNDIGHSTSGSHRKN